MQIPLVQQITAIVFSLGLVLVTLQLIRKNKLREQYALGWLMVSLVVLSLSIFGKMVTFLAGLFSVAYAPTLILVAGLLFMMVLLLTQTVTISSQADCIRDLTQTVTLMEWRLRQLENETLALPEIDLSYDLQDSEAHPHLNGHGASPPTPVTESIQEISV